jgi:threonine aldolase
VLAAAALHALDHHIDRLADDHANARRLADGLRGADAVASAPAQTNMVFVDLAPGRGADTVGRLRERGLLCTGIYKLRLVTHLDVSRVDIDRAVTILRETL